ncbi:MAG: molybdopterin-guanine dinucleotide biosynthesis protein MobB [Desulfohalobiaceae bacterium]
MKAISLVGYKSSGKTSLALRLCSELRHRGCKVAGVKFSHHHLDRQETDTARLAESCFVCAGITEQESSVVWSSPKSLPDLLPILQADVLVVEGGKSLGNLPRLLLTREPAEATELGAQLALASWEQDSGLGLPVLNQVKVLADLVLEKGFFLPGLDCGHCGREDCSQLAQEIVSGQASPEDCNASSTDLEIRVNGHPLAMNPFVQNIIQSTLQGMLSSLKGYTPGRVEITWEN